MKSLLVAAAFVFTHFAGSNGGGGHADGTGSEARFLAMDAVTVDPAGTLYVADTGNSTIRRISREGVVTTLAGAPYQHGSSDGRGSAARFSRPHGIVADRAGNLFVADSWNHTIRRISREGVVTTFAGRAGRPGHSDGTGSAARFHFPFGLALDRHGNLYVADEQNDAIRKIAPSGAVTTLARQARFQQPRGVAVDRAGNVYVADSGNHAIRRITAAGIVSTLAGRMGTAGHADGIGGAARFSLPLGIAVDGQGNLFVGDTRNHAVRKIAPDRRVTTIAGHGGGLHFPIGIAVDDAGTLFVADYHHHCIRRMTPAGVVTTVAGRPAEFGRVDGKASEARFAAPTAVAVDREGNVFVADTANHRIRRITPSRVVTTLPGEFQEPQGIATDGTNVYVTERNRPFVRRIAPNGDLLALGDRFGDPHGIAVDRQGNVWVADMADCTIRKIGDAAPLARACGTGLAIDAEGNLFVAGAGGVSRVTPAGEVTTIARLDRPWGIAIDHEGNLYVTDRGNHTISRIAKSGEVTTLAGLAGTFGSEDGTGTAAHFDHPTGIALDAAGNLYVADANNHAIRVGRSDVVTAGGIH